MLLQSSHTAEVDEVTMDQGANIRPLPLAVKTEPGTAQEVSLDIYRYNTVRCDDHCVQPPCGDPRPPALPPSAFKLASLGPWDLPNTKSPGLYAPPDMNSESFYSVIGPNKQMSLAHLKLQFSLFPC